MKLIYDKNCLYKNEAILEDWERKAFHLFSEKIQNKELKFPCIPAAQGFAMDHFRYAFVDDPEGINSLSDFARKFTYYSEISKTTGTYSSLIVFFNNMPETDRYTPENYEALFWKILSNIKQFDEEQWPADIPIDPENKFWEYCFAGEKYFMYCATPSHRHRNSRFFPYLMLAITPRWVLNEFGKNKIQSSKVKKEIRRRLNLYDTISPHPDLNQYGNEDNYEWKQYFLRDDHTSPKSCPFSGYGKNDIYSESKKNRDNL